MWRAQTEYTDSLTDEQWEIISTYQGPLHRELNEKMRLLIDEEYDLNSLSEEENWVLRGLLQIIAQAPPIEKDVWLWRGTSIEPSCHSTVTQFTSTTRDKNLAADQFRDQNRDCCLLQIRIPAGERVLYIGDAKALEEDEVLLCPGFRYELLRDQYETTYFTEIGRTQETIQAWNLQYVPNQLARVSLICALKLWPSLTIVEPWVRELMQLLARYGFMVHAGPPGSKKQSTSLESKSSSPEESFPGL